jgi:hypothetical protein
MRFMSLDLFGRCTMRQRSNAPLVPEMPTPTTTEPELTTDTATAPVADGGERRRLPERTVGVPLVPDCS